MTRVNAIVRNHLKNLLDVSSEEDAELDGTLQEVSESIQAPVEDLRAFRDGSDDALPKSTVAAFAKMIGSHGGIHLGSTESAVASWYRAHFANEEAVRLQRFTYYDTIDRTRTEANSALSCWADMVITGSVAGDYQGGAFQPAPIKTNESFRKILLQIADRINTYLLPDNQKHCLIRDMAKYGSHFEQLGLERIRGDVHISQMVPMPVNEMQILENPTPEKFYARVQPGSKSIIGDFPAWKIVHFANKNSRSDRYGRSIFECGLRSWVQVEAMEDAMMVRRLERAPQRQKHIIDVSDLVNQKDIDKRVKEYRTAVKKVKSVDSSGDYQRKRISPPAGEDFIVFRKSKDSPADVINMEGDAHLAEIEDFLHFWNKWLSGLGPPKHHLGYEQDTMRSVGTELHIVFARKARRMQINFMQALNHLYWIELLLRGIDPRKSRYVLTPPTMGTRDELVRAQVMQGHAATVKALADAFSNTGRQPSVAWFLRWIIGLDESAISELEYENVIVKKKSAGGDKDNDGPTKDPEEAAGAAAHVMENPAVAAEIRYTRFLLDERMIARMTPEQLVEYGVVCPGDLFPTFDIEECCRMLGIRELRDAEMICE